MKAEFPGAVPEIPVSNVDRAADYYRAAGKKWTTYISSGVAAKPRSSLRRNRSLGSCMSSQHPIWMAICCACSTISPGRPSDVGR
jgi:hypothetical protein